MKNFPNSQHSILILIAAAVLLSTTACNKKTAVSFESTGGAQSNAATSGGDVTNKDNKILNSQDVSQQNTTHNPAYIATEQLKYSHQIETNFKQIDDALKAMQDKANQSAQALKHEIQDTVKGLEKERDQYKKHYSSLKNTKTGWNNLKGQWETLNAHLNTFLNRVEIKLKRYQKLA